MNPERLKAIAKDPRTALPHEVIYLASIAQFMEVQRTALSDIRDLVTPLLSPKGGRRGTLDQINQACDRGLEGINSIVINPSE